MVNRAKQEDKREAGISMTSKQKAFCQEYLKDLNGTQAATRAGYSKKIVRAIASKNMTKHNIQEEIQRLMKERGKRTEITQDRVLKELASMGFSNIKDYVNKDPLVKGSIVFKDMDKISREKAGAIESIKVDTEKNKIEFKLHSKPKSIEMIGRHLGMFKDFSDQLAEVLYEISEQFMPRTKDKEGQKEDEEK